MNNVPNDDDEPDYLSDAFLQNIDAQSTRDAKQKQSLAAIVPPKNRRVDAETVLQEGLAKPITEENVGFKLLAKMGYKPASEAAKAPTNPPSESQVLEHHAGKGPVEIFLKRDRAGLGVAEESRKQARQIVDEELEKARNREQNEGEIKQLYRKSKGFEFESRRLRGQLIKIRKVEQNLCETLGLETPPVAVDVDPAEIDVSEDTSDTAAGCSVNVQNQVVGLAGELFEPDYVTILRAHVLKLRHAPFFYCFYCGVHYKDADDITESCPGETEDDHE
jgi:hypothetical protein